MAHDTSPGLPPILAAWDDHPVYGIIHPSGCKDVCDRYMAHVAEASYSTSQPSFQTALSDRNHKRDVVYFEGVTEGRRRQRAETEHVMDDLERCRAERKEAFEALGRYRIERNEAREEVEFLRSKLAACQTECERLTQRVADLTWDQSRQREDMKATPHERLEQSTRTASATLADQHTASVDITLQEVPRSPVPQVPTSYAAVASARLPAMGRVVGMSSGSPPSLQCMATAATGIVTPPQSTSPNSHPGPSPPPNGASLGIPSYVSQPQSAANSAGRNGLPKTVRQLQALMTAAHQPTNVGALRKVKALCSEAHATPKEQKTDLQKHLLANWRNPTTVPSQKTNPRLDDPIEVWAAYLSENQASWPRGVRRDHQGNPNISDLRASRLIARTRPEIDSAGTSTARHNFTTSVVQMFSRHGMYQACLDMTGVKVARELSFVRFAGPLTEITYEDLARHFAACGVTVEMAINEMEPWAREYEASVTIDEKLLESAHLL
jgi:hypothetical protein